MTNYFPIHINLEYKTVVIVGGGHVATVTHFSPLNVVVLKQTIAPKRYTLGIDDEEFSQRNMTIR